jgi:hypothetical protein
VEVEDDLGPLVDRAVGPAHPGRAGTVDGRRDVPLPAGRHRADAIPGERRLDLDRVGVAAGRDGHPVGQPADPVAGGRVTVRVGRAPGNDSAHKTVTTTVGSSGTRADRRDGFIGGS